jgi:hypothetical protein
MLAVINRPSKAISWVINCNWLNNSGNVGIDNYS